MSDHFQLQGERFMKAALRVLAVVGLLSLGACGGGGGSDKDLFSLWTRDGTGTPLDLSTAGFGSENYLNLYTVDGTRCICNLAIIGTQESGSIAVTGCISVPYNASKNPQCEASNGVGTYSKPGDVLSITRNGATGTFR